MFFVLSGFEFFLWWAFHSVADIYRHGFCGRRLTIVNLIKLITCWNPNYVGVNILLAVSPSYLQIRR